MFPMQLEKLCSFQKIAILWCWREWRSTLAFLRSQWVQDSSITLHDIWNVDISDFSGEVYSWPWYLKALSWSDVIIRSAWIPRTTLSDYLDIPSTTQTALFFSNYRWKVIWITWTKGKSTLSTLLYRVLDEAWLSVSLVGNIWQPVLDAVDFSADPVDFVVYELSSYMCDWYEFPLDIALINNLYFEHHADWHWSLEAYWRAKLSLLPNARCALLWTNVRDQIWLLWDTSLPTFKEYWTSWAYSFSWNSYFKNWSLVFTANSALLKWDHNKHNICWVFWICDELEIDTSFLITVLKDFSWLEHRLEEVPTNDWILWVNDANASMPSATKYALLTYWSKVDTLFYWGKKSWYTHDEVAELINELWVRNLVIFPDTGYNLLALLDREKFSICETNDMGVWVNFAKNHTASWKVALLSCWAPSYSCWKSFEEKWRLFKEAIIEG